MPGSLILNWGEAGGWYTSFSDVTKRVCLGQLAITYMTFDMDKLLTHLLSTREKNDAHVHTALQQSIQG